MHVTSQLPVGIYLPVTAPSPVTSPLSAVDVNALHTCKGNLFTARTHDSVWFDMQRRFVVSAMFWFWF